MSFKETVRYTVVKSGNQALYFMVFIQTIYINLLMINVYFLTRLLYKVYGNVLMFYYFAMIALSFFATKYPAVKTIIERNTNEASTYINAIGYPVIYCPISIKNEFPPNDPATTISEPMRLVTVMCCFSHKMPQAHIDAIPVPMIAVQEYKT